MSGSIQHIAIRAAEGYKTAATRLLWIHAILWHGRWTLLEAANPLPSRPSWSMLEWQTYYKKGSLQKSYGWRAAWQTLWSAGWLTLLAAFPTCTHAVVPKSCRSHNQNYHWIDISRPEWRFRYFTFVTYRPHDLPLALASVSLSIGWPKCNFQQFIISQITLF